MGEGLKRAREAARATRKKAPEKNKSEAAPGVKFPEASIEATVRTLDGAAKFLGVRDEDIPEGLTGRMPEPGTYGAIERKPAKVIDCGKTPPAKLDAGVEKARALKKCLRCEGPLVEWGPVLRRCRKCGINY